MKSNHKEFRIYHEDEGAGLSGAGNQMSQMCGQESVKFLSGYAVVCPKCYR